MYVCVCVLIFIVYFVCVFSDGAAAAANDPVAARQGSNWTWRDLIPVIKVDISTVRHYFYHHLFSISFLTYSCKRPAKPSDEFSDSS